MSQQQSEFRYYAFISYNHKDKPWADKLQHKLEHYKIPFNLNGKSDLPKAIRPIFKDTSELNPGKLTDQIREALSQSKYLIVICSPNSAQSKWVNLEVQEFISLGKKDNIIPFIIKGEPHASVVENECFPPLIRELLGDEEIIGANIQEIGTEAAVVKVVACMFGVKFDELYQRYKRWKRRKLILQISLVIIVLITVGCVWKYNSPTDVFVRLVDECVVESLPPLKNAKVTLIVNDEEKVDTLANLNEQLIFRHIPYKYINRQAHIVVEAYNFYTIDTMVNLSTDITLSIQRNEKLYGDVKFILYREQDMTPMGNVKLNIAGIETTSDNDGNVCLQVPLKFQSPAYAIDIAQGLMCDSVYMPCGERSVVFVK